MPTDEERLREAHLRAVTTAEASAVRAAAARAQQAGKRTMSNSIKVKQEGSNSIDYSIRGPGGMVEQLSFTLSWAPVAQGTPEAVGTMTVTTVVHRYLTVRSKMFGIPYGKPRVPALQSYRQFVEWMHKELAS